MKTEITLNKYEMVKQHLKLKGFKIAEPVDQRDTSNYVITMNSDNIIGN